MVTARDFPSPPSEPTKTLGLPANFVADAETLKIIVAPDSFKGTASSTDAATWIAEGIQSIIVDCEVEHIPMADGGEGTASLFDGAVITLPTTDAAGRLTEASYVYNDAEETAYIDIAAATGLPAVQDKLVPLTGDTYGTGVLIADAQTRGARRIVLGLGGSATMDGGTGILIALGATPINEKGLPLRPGGGSLSELHDIDTAHLNIPAASVEWVLLADSDFPAAGPQGAARTFGPQKGANDEQIEHVDAGLAHFCSFAGIDPEASGYGAAGGIPIGITWLSQLLHGNLDHVHLVSGARTFAVAQGLEERVENAHLVVTGEGTYDEQSVGGKVASVITDLAAKTGTTAAVIAGAFDIDVPEGVLAVEMSSPDEVSTHEREGTHDTDGAAGVRDQLIRAGAQVAVDYLNTSTTQG